MSFAVAFSSAAFAARTPAVGPGAIQRELEPQKELKASPKTVPQAPVTPAAPPGAAAVKLTLTELDIEGATVFPSDRLAAFGKPLLGHEVTLADVFGVAQAITQFYSEKGYPLSVAYVPAQEIAGGKVKIRVVEGYAGDIEITGDPGGAEPTLRAYAEHLKAVRPLTQSALERYMLLANDLPGLSVRAVIDKARKQDGAVKLILVVQRKSFDGGAEVDNRGSRAIGRERARLSATENGHLIGTERISLDVVQTFQTEELTYIYGRAETTVGSEGTTVAVDSSWSTSRPGTSALKAVDFKSDGLSVALEVDHPLVRSRSANVLLTGIAEFDEYKGDLLSLANSDDKLRILRGRALGAFADRLGGVTQGQITISQGLDLLDATTEGDRMKSRAGGSAVFTSALVTLSRLQPVSFLDLWLSGSAQIASRTLLASEECGYGGEQFGRAFDSYEISGENCLLGLAELRYSPSPGRGTFQPQVYAFYDAGMVQQRGTLLAGEAHRQTGQSVGAGVRFTLGQHVGGYLEVAQPLTRVVAFEGNDHARLFFTLSFKG